MLPSKCVETIDHPSQGDQSFPKDEDIVHPWRKLQDKVHHWNRYRLHPDQEPVAHDRSSGHPHRCSQGHRRREHEGLIMNLPGSNNGVLRKEQRQTLLSTPSVFVGVFMGVCKNLYGNDGGQDYKVTAGVTTNG